LKTYSNIITLSRNSREVYILDTIVGCSSGMENEIGGCYNDCYAAKSAKIYGYDFTKSILRHFKSEKHKRDIVNQISKIRMPFVRIGGSGDPSENWDHTISILKVISRCNKEIIIITRHWTILTGEQLKYFRGLNICINTSISALDKPEMLSRCLAQYQRIKKFCKSVLRIVSCDFNLNNETGSRLAKIQDALFKNESVLDTVFRPSKTNKFVTESIINIKQEVFNGKKTIASKLKRKTYMGKCSNCLEMCGVNIKSANQYVERPGLVNQLALFKK